MSTSRKSKPFSEEVDFREVLAEPFRTKMVERIYLLPRKDREAALKAAFYSHVHIKAQDVYIDLVTDSGTGAMSDDQWGEMMRADEAYMNAPCFFDFQEAVNEMFPEHPHVIPTHQGRAAESIMMKLLITQQKNIVLSNTHFDTTRAQVMVHGGTPVDLVGDHLWNFEGEDRFKGNFDIPKLEAALKRHAKDVAFVMITVVNNMAFSSPVSMENIREVKRLAAQHELPVYFDACRFSENAYFIKTYEPGYDKKTIQEITQEMMKDSQGLWVSAKKDLNVNIGGFIALKDEELARRCKELLVLNEGFPTYGGLAGRDLAAMAVGLREANDEIYLSHRVRQVEYLAKLLDEVGIPISKPSGGSGVFVDVGRLYEHLPAEKYPGTAFLCDLYLEGGIRAGAAPFNLKTVDAEGTIVTKTFQFARFAIPRRVYSKSHFDYVGRVMARVKEMAPRSKGYKQVWAPNSPLAAFFAQYAPRQPEDG